MRIGRGALVLAVGVAVNSGCTLLAPAPVVLRREMLAKVPVVVAEQTPHAATLLVLAPGTSAAYDTTRMAYVVGPYQIAYFGRTEWAARPSRMIHPLLVRTLQKAGHFSAVVAPPFTGHYTHALGTEILALQQDFTREPAEFRLILRAQLFAQPGNRVIATREIDVHEPMRGSTPDAGAVAANDATAKALKEVAQFVRARAN